MITAALVDVGLGIIPWFISWFPPLAVPVFVSDMLAWVAGAALSLDQYIPVHEMMVVAGVFVAGWTIIMGVRLVMVFFDFISDLIPLW